MIIFKLALPKHLTTGEDINAESTETMLITTKGIQIGLNHTVILWRDGGAVTFKQISIVLEFLGKIVVNAHYVIFIWGAFDKMVLISNTMLILSKECYTKVRKMGQYVPRKHNN